MTDVTVANLMRTRFSSAPSSAEYREGFEQCLRVVIDSAAPVRNPYSAGTVQADAYDAGFDDARRFLEGYLLTQTEIFARELAPILGWRPACGQSAVEFFAAISKARRAE